MTLPRFLAPSLDPDRREVALPVEEARHLLRVLRLQPGARVSVFDGKGREFVASVTTAARDRVVVRLEEAVEPQSAPRVPIALAQAILKSDKMDDVVRDATMLGVSEIVPLVSDHVSVKPSAIKRGRPAERWGRIAVASVKQCRRSTIPDVHEPVAFSEWIVDSGGSADGSLRLFLVEPQLTGRKVQSIRSLLGMPPPKRATIVVGPEGGWSHREADAAAESGCALVSLGPATLRADAVALVALSTLIVIWGE